MLPKSREIRMLFTPRIDSIIMGSMNLLQVYSMAIFCEDENLLLFSRSPNILWLIGTKQDVRKASIGPDIRMKEQRVTKTVSSFVLLFYGTDTILLLAGAGTPANFIVQAHRPLTCCLGGRLTCRLGRLGSMVTVSSPLWPRMVVTTPGFQ